jgi:hypothetical protein
VFGGELGVTVSQYSPSSGSNVATLTGVLISIVGVAVTVPPPGAAVPEAPGVPVPPGAAVPDPVADGDAPGEPGALVPEPEGDADPVAELEAELEAPGLGFESSSPPTPQAASAAIETVVMASMAPTRKTPMQRLSRLGPEPQTGGERRVS